MCPTILFVAFEKLPAPPRTYIVIPHANTYSLWHTVMAPLPKIADADLADCTQAAAAEAPSPRAKARNEQHKLPG